MLGHDITTKNKTIYNFLPVIFMGIFTVFFCDFFQLRKPGFHEMNILQDYPMTI